MKPSIPSRLLPALALAACSFAVRTASAQSADSQKLATAQTLFAAAQSAMERKDWATACPKLEEVTRLLPNGVGGHLTLAQCYEGAGRLASAWTEYLLAQSTAAQAIRAEQEKQAREKGETLKPRLAQMIIVVPESTRALPGLSIERDGVPVGPSMWSTPVPVDRGSHTIVATATGKPRWQKVVVVPSDGATVPVDVDLGGGAPGPAPAPPPEARPPEAQGGPPPPRPPAEQPPAPSSWTGVRIGGVVVGSAGVLGLAVGGVFGGLALSQKAASNAGTPPHCVGNRCDATGTAARNSGLTDATISTATFIVGAAALAGGITMIAVGGPSKPKGAEARLRLGPGSAFVEGAW